MNQKAENHRCSECNRAIPPDPKVKASKHILARVTGEFDATVKLTGMIPALRAAVGWYRFEVPPSGIPLQGGDWGFSRADSHLP